MSDNHVWDAMLSPSLARASPKETAIERLAICETCPFYNKDKMCEQCGCFMPDKVHDFNATCPVKSW
jgi:hypothetical protein